MKGQKFAGLVCPDSPEHGPLTEVDGRMRCVHQSHDGRPKTHPLGPAPVTKSVFTLAEVLGEKP